MIDKFGVSLVVLFLSTSSASSGDLNWMPSCERDAMSDKVICAITDYDVGLLVFFNASTIPESVCILGNDFPGRSGAIRIDKNQPVITSDTGCTPARHLVAEMESGHKVVVRRYEWPDDYPKDREGSLVGFSKSMKTVEILRKNAK